MMGINRRTFLTGLAVTPWAASARAQELPPAVMALMNHPAAIAFEAPPAQSGLPIFEPIFGMDGAKNWQERFIGKAVLLDLWASWCGPCLVESPGLDALSVVHNSRNFEVVVLKTADPETSLISQKEKYIQMGARNLSVLADGSQNGWSFFKALKVNHRASGVDAGLPMASLIGPDGREIARTYGTISGGKWTNPQMMDFVRQFAQAWGQS